MLNMLEQSSSYFLLRLCDVMFMFRGEWNASGNLLISDVYPNQHLILSDPSKDIRGEDCVS